MSVFLVRVFSFTFLPLLLGFIIQRWDPKTVSRFDRVEIYLLFLFGLGVAGSGIGGFFGHIFLSDVVAESVGWPSGSPFQLEMGFANLALGVLGILATSHRDGFREATVIAVTVIGVGASLVHAFDILTTGNLAPGNTLQNVANLVRPAFLIYFLRSQRRMSTDDVPAVESPDWQAWQQKHVRSVGILTGLVAGGFGMGFAFSAPAAGAGLGVLAGLVVVWFQMRPSKAATMPPST